MVERREREGEKERERREREKERDQITTSDGDTMKGNERVMVMRRGMNSGVLELYGRV